MKNIKSYVEKARQARTARRVARLQESACNSQPMGYMAWALEQHRAGLLPKRPKVSITEALAIHQDSLEKSRLKHLKQSGQSECVRKAGSQGRQDECAPDYAQRDGQLHL